MTEGIITLSHAELDRVSIIRSIISRRLTQAQAAQRLQLSVRQVKRLTRAYRTCGAAGMASTHRGRCPGNTISDAVRQQALALIRAHYIDFGPTFAHEKLTELHDCHCSVRVDHAGPGWVSGYRLMGQRMTGLKGEARAAL